MAWQPADNRYDKMIYNRVGRSGLKLPAVSLGLWHNFGDDTPHDRKVDMCRTAFDLGITHFDLANNYGPPAGTAETAFGEAVEKGNGAYKAMALQQRAGIAVAANRIPDAIALFDEAAKASSDPILHDTAVYKSALLMMDNGATLEDLEAKLEPLTKEGRPMLPFAQEALGLARLQFNKPAEAREVFVLLTLGQDIPDSLRQRAQAAISQIDAGIASGLPAIVAAQSVNPPAAPPAPTVRQLSPEEAQAAQAQAAQAQGAGAEQQ